MIKFKTTTLLVTSLLVLILVFSTAGCNFLPDYNTEETNDTEETELLPDNTPVFTRDKTSIFQTLTWSDEFDGDKINESNWNFEIGNGTNGWGNQELQYYRRENAAVSGGTLKITAKREDVTQSGRTYKYTSARLTTRNKRVQTYGRFEARIKLPVQNAMWPAFWMLNNRFGQNPYPGAWPKCGEIDIMESRGRHSTAVYQALHYGPDGDEGDGQQDNAYFLPKGQTIAQWHVYGLEWEAHEMRFYVDDIMVYKTNDWYWEKGNTQHPFPAPFNMDFFVIINLAVGGKYDAWLEPDPDFKEAVMEIDYVRFYK